MSFGVRQRVQAGNPIWAEFTPTIYGIRPDRSEELLLCGFVSGAHMADVHAGARHDEPQGTANGSGPRRPGAPSSPLGVGEVGDARNRECLFGVRGGWRGWSDRVWEGAPSADSEPPPT